MHLILITKSLLLPSECCAQGATGQHGVASVPGSSHHSGKEGSGGSRGFRGAPGTRRPLLVQDVYPADQQPGPEVPALQALSFP